MNSKNRRSEMADAGEYQQYPDVKPIFDGSYAILPFFKDNVCPGTFVSFFGDCGNDNSQLVGCHHPNRSFEAQPFLHPSSTGQS